MSVFNFVLFIIKISKRNYLPTKHYDERGCQSHPALTERWLIITGRGLLFTEKNENKTQRIGFPDSITNIYIHKNFLLYGSINWFRPCIFMSFRVVPISDSLYCKYKGGWGYFDKFFGVGQFRQALKQCFLDTIYWAVLLTLRALIPLKVG